MEKISLKLYEFYNLESELNGVTNQQTGEKISAGLLAEKLKLTTKYWLTELGKKVAAEKAGVVPTHKLFQFSVICVDNSFQKKMSK